MCSRAQPILELQVQRCISHYFTFLLLCQDHVEVFYNFGWSYSSDIGNSSVDDVCDLLPYWYHFEDKYPRTDVGLFHECFNEGLNKGCHVFADNAGMEYHYCQANYDAKYQVTVLICLLIPLIL